MPECLDGLHNGLIQRWGLTLCDDDMESIWVCWKEQIMMAWRWFYLRFRIQRRHCGCNWLLLSVCGNPTSGSCPIIAKQIIIATTLPHLRWLLLPQLANFYKQMFSGKIFSNTETKMSHFESTQVTFNRVGAHYFEVNLSSILGHFGIELEKQNWISHRPWGRSWFKDLNSICAWSLLDATIV